MRTMFNALLLLFLATACTRGTSGTSGTTGAGSAQAPPRSSERPLANRREAQELLDSARSAVVADRPQAAAAFLRRSAAFFTVQANSPPSAGSADLLDAARALRATADALHLGRPVDVAQLDRISAHANFAEAERHGSLANVAWATHSVPSVCDELLMAADHVERGAADGDLTLPVSARDLLAEIRTLVAMLGTVRGVDIHAIDEPIASLHIEIRALHARLDTETDPVLLATRMP